jgi:hypothetical protein
VIGVVLILLVIFILGPIGLFIVGGAFSALTGWLLSDGADIHSVEESA